MKVALQNIGTQGTTPTSLLGLNLQLPEKWNNMLTKLEILQRERLFKVKECLVQIMSHASEDELVRTMMENEETRAFAD